MARFSAGNGFPDVVVTGVAMTNALATDMDGTRTRLPDSQKALVVSAVVADQPRVGDHRYVTSNRVRRPQRVAGLRQLLESS